MSWVSPDAGVLTSEEKRAWMKNLLKLKEDYGKTVVSNSRTWERSWRNQSDGGVEELGTLSL